MKKLIIAEKPSVAGNIAEATGGGKRENGYIEGDHYIITWVFGHLLQLYDAVDYDEKMAGSWKMENFPFIPKDFMYKIKTENGNRKKTDEGARRQLDTIKKLMDRDDVGEIVSATDWDREGQIIADEIFKYIKTDKKINRLLLNEWTRDEVSAGLDSLKSNTEMESLSDAGFGRQTADWLIGINLTSVATVKYANMGYDALLNVGRVLMPTLKIIYDRDMEIEKFESSKYYKVLLTLENEKGETFEGTFYRPVETVETEDSDDGEISDGKIKRSEKFTDKEEADKILEALTGEKVRVTEKDVDTKRENPPYLFNLSNLQGYITGRYNGWTADKVLKVAQDLYEKKYITYPRTASSVLDESLKDKVRKVLATVGKATPFESELKFKDTKRIFDSSKVESHSAIMPTYVLPQKLSEEERQVYEAVKNRFLAQFLPQAVSEETRLEIKPREEIIQKSEIMDSEDVIIVRGKVQKVEGFRQAEKIQSKDTVLPDVEKGEVLTVKDGKVSEVVKKPPKHHTEKTLLKVMETCGKSVDPEQEEDSEEMMMSILSGFSIGTPATRAETIKKLKTAGYITTKNRSLRCTDMGKMMVETFPVRELFDLDYTGRLEKTLADIERGKFKRSEFMSFIKGFVADSVEKIKGDKTFGGTVKIPEDAHVVGKCPECGNPVVETEKAFGCSNWRNGCGFTVWKDDKYIQSFGKKVTPKMVELLLENGKVGFKGLISKKGNRFSAYFIYEKGEDGRYHWRMEFI